MRRYGQRVAARSKHDVQTLHVDPAVWAHALAAADGDARRIEIRGRDDVIVHNEPLPPDKRVNLTHP